MFLRLSTNYLNLILQETRSAGIVSIYFIKKDELPKRVNSVFKFRNPRAVITDVDMDLRKDVL